MKTYDGFCRGGPWDGKLYAGEKKTFQIEMIKDASWALMGMASPEVLHGEYCYILGQWIWHDLSSV